MARFAVIGLGRFGATLASRLYELGHEVLGVDVNEELVQAYRDRMTEVAVLDVRDKSQVRALGLKDFDTVIISVGEHLEASTLAALYCKEMGVKVIARAVSEDHGKILDALGVDEVLYPERDMAERLAERLSSKNLLDFVSLGPDFSIIEVATPASFLGKTLAELDIRRRFGVHVIALRDVLTETVTLAPPPDVKLRDSDVLVVLGGREELERFQRVK
ncbi:MAG: potassium channel family protein [Thermoanaerobaculaceae bacterium]